MEISQYPHANVDVSGCYTYIQCNQEREQNFQNRYLRLKIAQIGLLLTRIATTNHFRCKTSFSPYIAKREAIHVRGTFWACFDKNDDISGLVSKELRLHV